MPHTDNRRQVRRPAPRTTTVSSQPSFSIPRLRPPASPVSLTGGGPAPTSELAPPTKSPPTSARSSSLSLPRTRTKSNTRNSRTTRAAPRDTRTSRSTGVISPFQAALERRRRRGARA